MTGPMRLLRAMFLTLLMIAVLPWDTPASARAPQSERAVTAQTADIPTGCGATDRSDAPQLTGTGHQIPEPALPGKTCHPDNLMPPAPDLPAWGATGMAMRPATGVFPGGAFLARAAEPPRF